MVEAGPAYEHDYMTTFRAFNRMRRQLGRENYPWARFTDRDKYEAEHGIRP
jgi:hypothetical protein